MKFVLVLVWALIFGACTTFNANENGLRRACKSGVAEYDDGSMNFKCKEDRNERTEAPERAINRFDRITK